jgi:hypothetical protein
MIDPIRMLFRRRLSRKTTLPSSLKRIRRVRLHAELLEPRQLMAADAANVASDLNEIPTQNDSESLVVAELPSQNAAAAVITKSHVAEDEWAQFGSKAAFEAWLVETAVSQYGSLFGQRGYSGWHGWQPHVAWNSAVVFRNALATASNDFSSTNLQEAGVDEADLVETDGS